MKKKKFRFKRIAIILLILMIIIGLVIIKNKKEIETINSAELSRSLSYDEVKPDDEKVEDVDGNEITAVHFDAFFLKDRNGDGIAESIRGTCNEVGSQANLYMELNVMENGYLKNGVITINSNNFYLNTSIVKDNEIKENYISTNTKEIKLNDIGNGTQKLLITSVRSGDYSNSYSKTYAIGNDTTKYSKENSVTFSGIFVNNEGIEKEFTKTVPFVVDWYGDINCSITPKTQTITVKQMESLNSDDGLKLNFDITVAETKNKLIMESSEIKGSIPELNGYKPLSVKITGSNVTYTYDEETNLFTAKRAAIINENGVVTSNSYTSSNSGTRYNQFNFEVIYPSEAYDSLGADITSFEVAIPIEAINTGYNNPNEEDGFNNPYISNKAEGIVVTTWKKYVEQVGQVYSPSFNIYVGKYISSPYYNYVISKEKPLRIYNGISLTEKDDIYNVQWRAYTGTNGITDGIIMNETNGKTDNFLNVSNESISMDELTTNKSISFTGALNTLGENGWIKVYDNSNDSLIKTFNSKNWNSEFVFEKPVKHLRIETSKTNASSNFYVNFVKELDDEYITENFTREEVYNLSFIYSYLDGYMLNQKTEENEEVSYWYKSSVSNKALYESPISIANISIKPDTISTHITAENEKITIQTITTGYNQELWKNGTFLVELPEEIIFAEINEIKTNNENVKISAYDVYEENGKYFIKILTENEIEDSYSIEIDCNLTPDPRIPKRTKDVKLYAQNEIASDYYYEGEDIRDIDGDSNITEKLNVRTISLTMDPGSSLSTTQVGSNYDGEGSVTIAPRVAKTDKDQRSADITISATNNYTYDIQDIKILGVIPFEGNKFVISNKDLGSTFTTYMNDSGISTLTDSLKDLVTIYYSELEEPTEDISDSNNGWKLSSEITDWTKIKTYIIVVDNSYKLASKQTIEFKYTIEIPKGIDYNEVSYSEHAIYFALDADEGLYYTSTGCAKLGFMIAKQYDLEIIKYQEDTEKLLKGITFTVTEEGEETSTIQVTNDNGKIVIPGLYVERYYTIKELKTIDDYVLNSEEIKFYTYSEINEDGTESLYITYPEKEKQSSDLKEKYSWVRSSEIIAPDAEKKEDYKIQIKLDNEVKAKLSINKVDKESGNKLKNVKFRITGQGKNGEILTTDSNGNINISGLYLEQEYILEEIKNTGYYIPQKQIKFTIKNNNGNFGLEYTNNNSTKNKEIKVEDSIPTLKLDLENEKIPTYSLRLTKYAKDEKNEDGSSKVLDRAQFIIKGEGIKTEGKIYTTDENGVLTINDLYEYVEGKYITGIYTLSEIYAPEGYSLDSTEIVFKGYRENGELKIEFIEGENAIRKIEVIENDTTSRKSDWNIENPTSNNPIFCLGVENSQIFSLFKYYEDDLGKKQPISGTKFKITDLEGNYVTGTDGKIVGEWEDTTPEQLPVPSMTYSSTGTYIWTQREDGTWESTGTYHQPNKSATLKSNDFYLKQTAILKFDWAASSESTNYDYIYYTITNLDTKKAIGGSSDTKARIGGGKSSDTYETLIFVQKEFELLPGNYRVEFTYRKDGSGDTGLDSGFIKNIRLEEKPVEQTGEYLVTTNEAGKITANLPEGLYKAIEVDVDDKFVLKESEKDRTTEFGIGVSQSATWDWITGIQGNGWNYINSVEKTKDGGIIASGKFSKYVIDNVSKGIDINNDGEEDKESLGQNDGIVISYDQDGNCNWAKTIGGDNDDGINKVIQTSDGGYLAVGYVYGSTINYDGTPIPELSKSSEDSNLAKKDGVLIKIKPNGDYDWGVRIGGLLDDEIESVIETSQNNFVITGKFFSREFKFFDKGSNEIKTTLTNNSEMGTFVASYSSSGNYNWGNLIVSSSTGASAPDVTEYSGGLGVAVNNGTGAYIYWYDLAGNVLNVKINNSSNSKFSIGGTSKITSIDLLSDGNLVAGVNYESKQFDARIYKIVIGGSSGTTVPIYTLTGTYDEYVSEVCATSDGGILFGGWYYSKDTTDGNDLIFPEKSGEHACDGYVIKLDSENNVSYSSRLYGDNYDIVNSVTESKNGSLVSGGYFNSGTFSATNCTIERDEDYSGDPELLLTNKGNADGFVIAEGESAPAVPKAEYKEIENEIKKFKITTEVVKNNGVFGGDIDGQVDIALDGTEYTKDGIRYVETVKYDENSVNKIKITPEENYKIVYIKINDKEKTDFTIAEDGSVELPIFENVKKDIHIQVQFSNTISDLEVNHYLWTKTDGATTTKVSESLYSSETIGNKYTTVPATDIEYVLITNEDFYGSDETEILSKLGYSDLETALTDLNYMSEELTIQEAFQKFLDDVYIPMNYTGTYKAGDKEIVNYYYKEKTYTLTVHHYLEGTNEPVPKKDTTDEKVPSEFTEGYFKNQEYQTNEAPEDLIDYSVYELVEEPINKAGTIIENTEVIYYYKIKTADLRFKKVAEEDENITIQGTEFALYELLTENSLDNQRINTNGDDTNWKLVARYTSSEIGIVKLEDLPINSEYRLVELRSSNGRMIPDGEWKIEFIYGNYDENDSTIKEINGVKVRITAIGNPPAFKVNDEGKLQVSNKEFYNIPTSGGIGIKDFYKMGVAVIIGGVIILIIAKKRYNSRKKK